MEYTCNAAVRTIRLWKTSQIEGNCFPQQGQPVSGQAVLKPQLFINGARAAGAGSGQARVTTQLKVRLGTAVGNAEKEGEPNWHWPAQAQPPGQQRLVKQGHMDLSEFPDAVFTEESRTGRSMSGFVKIPRYHFDGRKQSRLGHVYMLV